MCSGTSSPSAGATLRLRTGTSTSRPGRRSSRCLPSPACSPPKLPRSSSSGRPRASTRTRRGPTGACTSSRRRRSSGTSSSSCSCCSTRPESSSTRTAGSREDPAGRHVAAPAGSAGARRRERRAGALRCRAVLGQLHALPRSAGRGRPGPRPRAEGQRRARRRLLPAHGLHAACRPARPARAFAARVQRAPARRADRVRRIARPRSRNPLAATAARQRLRGDAALHRPLLGLPPGGRPRRLRDGSARPAADERDCASGRGGRAGRPVPDASLLGARDLGHAAERHRRVRRVRQASRRSRRLVDRRHRALAGGDGHVADRGRGDRLHLHVARKEASRVTKIKDLLVALLVLALGRKRKPRAEHEARIVEQGSPARGAENAVLALFFLATLASAAFIVVFAWDKLGSQTQWLGLCIGLAVILLAAACVVIAHKLVVTEELVHEYPDTEHPDEQLKIEQIVDESGSRFTRKRLVTLAGMGALGTLGLAALTPAASLGPLLDTDPLYRTPWRRGRRLVAEDGRPLTAGDIEEEAFYTAYPEGADRELLGSPLVVVRLPLAEIVAERRSWAPEGIVAYSKVCTHAGCAIALYRKPTFAPV